MITVFGSINVDMVMRVDALPRPGETVLCPDFLLVPGGKGANQALAAARAGASVRMVGRVGRDSLAETALSLLRADGVDLSAVGDSELSTCCATVWVDRTGENAIVVASGANRSVSAAQLDDATLESGDWLMLQMEVPAEENWMAARQARARGAKIILSVAPAAPVPDTVLAEVDVLLVNEIEAQMVASALGLPDRDPIPVVDALVDRYGGACILTLGARGAVAKDPDAAFMVPALPVNAMDTTGAGDAFAGILAAALDSGLPMDLAVRRASAGAGLSCTQIGAQPSLPTGAAIDAALGGLPPNKTM